MSKAKRTYSILRSAQEVELGKLVLTGRVIDLGGHKGSSYYSLIRSERPIETVNLDEADESGSTHKEKSRADHVFDLEDRFPLENESYDTVLCINVMEHIFRYDNLIGEALRILKPGGRLYLSVPFLFSIHASPNDFFRYTHAALKRILTEHGFVDIAIAALGHGPASVCFQNFGGGIPTMFLKMICKAGAVGFDVVCSRYWARYASIKDRCPLGYFVSAERPGRASLSRSDVPGS